MKVTGPVMPQFEIAARAFCSDVKLLAPVPLESTVELPLNVEVHGVENVIGPTHWPKVAAQVDCT